MTATAVAAVDVTVAGQAWRPAGDRLLSVRVSGRLAQPAQCELGLAVGARWPDGWALGADLRVRVRGEDDDLFVGEVTCVELIRAAGPLDLRVRAYDRLHRLRRRQRPRVFTDVTAADLAGQLVADLGLAVSAAEPGPRLDRVVQHRQSDLALLVEVCAAAGLHPVVRDTTLHLLTLSGYGEAAPLRFGATLWEARVEANLDRAARKVTAVGWHAQRAETFTHEAETPRGPTSTLPAHPVAAGADGEATLVDRPVRDEQTVAGLAQSALDTRAATAVTLHGVAAGDAALRPGTRIGVRGLADAVDGSYVLTGTTHTVDGAGYQCTFTTSPPEPPATAGAGAAGVTVGVVTDVDDPDGMGRVRVSLPALGGLDAGWLAVLCPGAGPGRGLVALPDPDDTVLVALPHSSPADGIVLGSLYGTTAPPDPGVVGGRVRRWSLRTAGGQTVVVDDDKHLVKVANKAGSYLELAPGTVRLHAEADLVVDSPGHGITIRAASVDFEHAGLPNPLPDA